jgi:hypothetical protein
MKIYRKGFRPKWSFIKSIPDPVQTDPWSGEADLLSDGPESVGVGHVVDATLPVNIVDGVRAGDPGVGVAGLDLGRVDVAVAVVVVAELILL